jgi:hypothetical protein
MNAATLAFGLTSSALYLAWAAFSYFTEQRHMTGALVCYAIANLFLLWPLIK